MLPWQPRRRSEMRADLNGASPRRPPRRGASVASVATAADASSGPAGANSGKTADARTQLAQFGAGALAGLVNTLVLSPLDVVKTRLQVQGSATFASNRYHGLVDALRAMLREEGFRSYYRGLSASLWAFVPNWAIYWYSYETFKRAYTPSGRRPSPMVHVLSALSAGGLTAVTTAPFWTLKSRLQVDMAVGSAHRRYRSVPHGFRKIMRQEGVSGLYKGLTATLLGLGHVAIQFPLYEHLKTTLSRRADRDGEGDGQVRASHILAASSMSKVVASAFFYPHEVLRTRIQVDRTAVRSSTELVRIVDMFSEILKRDGAKGLYRGFAANLMRTVPACMLTFTSYELAKRYAESHATRYRRAKLGAEAAEAVRQRDSRR